MARKNPYYGSSLIELIDHLDDQVIEERQTGFTLWFNAACFVVASVAIVVRCLSGPAPLEAWLSWLVTFGFLAASARNLSEQRYRRWVAEALTDHLLSTVDYQDLVDVPQRLGAVVEQQVQVAAG